MYSKERILEILNEENLFIDNFILEAFIKNWKIEPIYENAEGIEFFDDMALEKIRNGIKQKNEPKYDVHIVDKDEIIQINNLEKEQDKQKENTTEENTEVNLKEESTKTTQTEATLVAQEQISPSIVKKELETELRNITLDISNQTLTVLAESIARKITSDVSDFIKNTEFIKKSDFIDEVVLLGEYKKDNQILVKKINELIADNKILLKRIETLEKENNSYVKIFGNIYAKNQ